MIDEEATENEKINMIKNQEYKNLQNIRNYNSVMKNQYQYHKCYTEPCADEIVSMNSSEGNDIRANNQPFFPKSHTKQNSTNFYYKDHLENLDEDECEEYSFIF